VIRKISASIPDLFSEETIGFWLLGLAIVAVVIFLILLSITENVAVEVNDVWWRREVQVEDYAPREQGGWTHPSDAYNVSKSWRVRSYRTVDDGCATRDEDGHCTSRRTHLEAVYDWYYEYTVDRWQYRRSLVALEHNRSPYTPVLDFVPCNALYCEREGQHYESYSVQFSKDVYCELPQPIWAEYRVGDFYHLDVGKYIYIPRCETLKRALTG
jgi:hypothetical protein